MSVLDTISKIPILKRIFKRNIPNSLTFEKTFVGDRQTTHIFEATNRNDASFCSVMQYIPLNNGSGILQAKLAWRTGVQVERGDVFILTSASGQKSYRLIKVDPPNGDTFTGIAYCLQ